MIQTTSEALEKLRVTRRVGYFFTLFLTYHAFEWCTAFVYDALDADTPALEISAIIAAVLVPVTGLQTAVISFYHKDRPAPWQYQSPEVYTKPAEASDASSTAIRD